MVRRSFVLFACLSLLGIVVVIRCLCLADEVPGSGEGLPIGTVFLLLAIFPLLGWGYRRFFRSLREVQDFQVWLFPLQVRILGRTVHCTGFLDTDNVSRSYFAYACAIMEADLWGDHSPSVLWRSAIKKQDSLHLGGLPRGGGGLAGSFSLDSVSDDWPEVRRMIAVVPDDVRVRRNGRWV